MHIITINQATEIAIDKRNVVNIDDWLKVVEVLKVLAVNAECVDERSDRIFFPRYLLLLTNWQSLAVCPVGPKVNGVWVFDLNPLYLENGQVRLSASSIWTFCVQKNCFIGEAADLFNAAMDTHPSSQLRVAGVVGL